MTSGPPLRVPDALVASYDKYFGDGGRIWIAGLPRLAEDCLDRWDLRPDGWRCAVR
jgi:hypothetical protein